MTTVGREVIRVARSVYIQTKLLYYGGYIPLATTNVCHKNVDI